MNDEPLVQALPPSSEYWTEATPEPPAPSLALSATLTADLCQLCVLVVTGGDEPNPKSGSCTVATAVAVGGRTSDQPARVVVSIEPAVPATKPCSVSAKATEARSWLVGQPCVRQVRPPLVVARMTPPTPTAQPRRLSATAMVYRSGERGVVARATAQWAPPSLVSRMTPLSPTTQACSASQQVTPFR